MGVNANWRSLGCAIALLVAGGCEQLFQVEGAERRDAMAVGGDISPPADAAPNTHDEDGDGIYDLADDCPSDVNPATGGLQLDTDGDGVGDACDPTMGTRQMRQFFDPLLTLDPATWTTTINSVSSWSEDGSGDAVVSASGPAFAVRALPVASGTVEVWVADLDVSISVGRVWGVMYPADTASDPTAGSAAGCLLVRNSDGTDEIYVSTGFTSIDAGVLPGPTNTGPIRIIASLDLASLAITCSVSRPPNPPTNLTQVVSVGGGHLALFASDPGLTFNSVFYMTSP